MSPKLWISFSFRVLSPYSTADCRIFACQQTSRLLTHSLNRLHRSGRDSFQTSSIISETVACIGCELKIFSFMRSAPRFSVEIVPEFFFFPFPFFFCVCHCWSGGISGTELLVPKAFSKSRKYLNMYIKWWDGSANPSSYTMKMQTTAFRVRRSTQKPAAKIACLSSAVVLGVVLYIA